MEAAHRHSHPPPAWHCWLEWAWAPHMSQALTSCSHQGLDPSLDPRVKRSRENQRTKVGRHRRRRAVPSVTMLHNRRAAHTELGRRCVCERVCVQRHRSME